MCGIYGVVGSSDAKKEIFTGLKRLNYRGYDSWGLAVVANAKLNVFKDVGEIKEEKGFDELPNGMVGIGHTRWATHGAVSVKNAHPHFATDKSFVVVHNGIVENYLVLKRSLIAKRSKFVTETDTEIIVRLIEVLLKKGKDLGEATRLAFKQLKGRNTIMLLSNGGSVVAARNGSPLVVGLADNGVYFSSDALSFAPVAKRIVVVENDQMVQYDLGKLTLRRINDGKEVKINSAPIAIKADKINKEGFDHYMIKEIFDTPTVLRQVAAFDEALINKLALAIKKAKNVYTIGSGTAGLAAAQIAYYLRVYGGVNARELIGAETSSYKSLWVKGDLIIAPSQSGETADVLEALEAAKNKGVRIASYVNMVGSMMTRMSDYAFMAQAGPEICVMSTKIFVSQIAWGYLLAKSVQGQFEVGQRNIKKASLAVKTFLDEKRNHRLLIKLANELVKAHDIFLLGKGQSLNIVKEGMVKIIEGTYKHAHAIAAGDLKHYAITIIDKGIPVIAVVPNDEVKADVLNAVSEVRARGATVVGISSQRQEQFDRFIAVPGTSEVSGLVTIIPLQLLSYYMSKKLGNNVDKPRNIAKSVTVK